MSLVQLQREAAALSTSVRRQLMAFLVSLQTERDEELRVRLASKIDDQDATHWMDLDELKPKLGAD